MSRFAHSALSLKNKATAVHEELMIDKQTGQLAIKTSEVDGGDIVSFDALLAKKLHYDRTRNYIVMTGVPGDLFDASPGFELPAVVEDTTELVTTPISLTANGLFESFLISVDAVTLLNGTETKLGPEPMVEVILELTKSDTTKIPVSTTLSLTDNNLSTRLKSEYEELHGTLTDISIKSIKLKKDPSIIVPSRTILLDILVFMESEE